MTLSEAIAALPPELRERLGEALTQYESETAGHPLGYSAEHDALVDTADAALAAALELVGEQAAEVKRLREQFTAAYHLYLQRADLDLGDLLASEGDTTLPTRAAETGGE